MHCHENMTIRLFLLWYFHNEGFIPSLLMFIDELHRTIRSPELHIQSKFFCFHRRFPTLKPKFVWNYFVQLPCHGGRSYFFKYGIALNQDILPPFTSSENEARISTLYDLSKFIVYHCYNLFFDVLRDHILTVD